MEAETKLGVVVAYAPASRQVSEIHVELPVGSTVAQALQASGLAQLFPPGDLDRIAVGVWGRKAQRDQLLRAGDRVEVYRPLRVDPKVARRERFARQGARTAGLFASRRAGAKAGY